MAEEQRAEFLQAYDEHRVMNQLRWYGARSTEYENANTQQVLVSEFLLVLAGICGVLSGASVEPVIFGIVATALAAASVVLNEWGDLIGFKLNTELYRAAEAALGRRRPDRPQAGASDEEVRTYIRDIEAILLGEVTTWAQKWGSEAQAQQRPAGGTKTGTGGAKTGLGGSKIGTGGADADTGSDAGPEPQ